jgi:hypothetical protein
MDEHQESDLSIHHYLSDQKELNIEDLKRQVKNRGRKAEEYTYISVKVDKLQVLRGEVLLQDLHELFLDLLLDVEDFLELRFKDIICEIKIGGL